MAKNTTDATTVTDQAAATDASVDAALVDVPSVISLDEYCIQLSQVNPRVELISGFHATEVAAGHARDTADAFAARFDIFINQPA